MNAYACELVSGKKINKNAHDPPDNHRRIHIVQVHPSACAAKPPRRGPRTGPLTAARPHRPMTIARQSSFHMSTRLAPPVASAGLPTNPARNRKGKSAPRFLLSAVGTWTMTKMRRDTMYTDVRPSCGISESGERNMGPMPYPTTNIVMPSEAATGEMPNC